MKQVLQGVKNAGSEGFIAVSSIFKAIIVAYIITLILFAVFSIFLAYTDFSESAIPTVISVTTVVSVIAAGMVAARSAKSKGWLNGAFVGLLYVIVLYLGGSLALSKFSINQYMITMLFVGVLAGSVGGIAGINMSKGRKHHK